MSGFLDVIKDTLVDGVKMLPFLFLAYIVLEWIEHKTGDKMNASIQKAEKFGPFVGGVLGVIPQCGFSTAAANLYAGRIITLGTLIAVFLSTSDEMLPILLSKAVPIQSVLWILAIKCVIGVGIGVFIDILIRIFRKDKVEHNMVSKLCEHEHCHCEKGIFRSAVHHTVRIWFFIVLFSFILNIVIYLVGEKTLADFITSVPMLDCVLSGLVGLIPNCASSVVITELWVEGVLSVPAMLSGLLVNAGVGLVVLYRTNSHWKENVKITILLYAIGVVAGFVVGHIVSLGGYINI